MKIKKLSIFGFKSFMDRLEISFPLGISGIVGPNGCGKSNIVDAIRWCMGEQSPKQLRGRQMEDVIFSGAGDHKPLGMAEVSVCFENGDGSFPSPFTQDAEMAITRRLYRSGESEYLINNVPCRLKDIQEIFMDTGLGNRAYSIIGQGRIGAIIEQKPEETRVMLEEAAGITKYRRKVEASQRKIELTQANLQRVEDILSEVRRQMGSLKRQAAKARRYKVISEKIQNLELALYSNTYHELQQESGRRKASTELLIQEEISRSAELSTILARLENMGLELEEADNQLSILRSNYLQLKDRTHRRETAIESLDSEMRMLQELEGRLHKEMEQIKERLSAHQQEKVELEKKLVQMKETAHNLAKEVELSEERLRARQVLLKQVRGEYEEVRDEIQDGLKEELGLGHESNYLTKRIDEITDRRSRLENELAEVQAKTENVLKASEKKSLSREFANKKLVDTETSIEHQNLHLKELEQAKKRVEMELRSAEADFHVYQSRLQSLQTITENFEGYKIGVRTIMKAKDLEPLQKGRIMGLVADVLQVDPKYEQAVEAVLADKLQYIIVESQDDAKEAIEYLKAKARGKSSFVPMRDLNGNGYEGQNRAPYPRLRELVSVPEKFRPLLDALLGDAVLLESLEQAISLWRGNGKNLCLVTIEGDMVDQRGVISGGKLLQASRGLLSRKREMTELRDKVGHCQEQLEERKVQLESIIQELEEKKTVLESLVEEKWACQDEVNEYDKAIFRLSQELDQLEMLAKRIENDLADESKEQNRHKKELSRIQEDLEQRKQRRRQVEEFFHRKDLELKECEQEYEQLRDEVAKLKSDYGILQEEQRSLVREMERLDEYAEESRKRIEQIGEDISLGGLRREEFQKKKASYAAELEHRYEELRTAEEKLKAADHARQVSQSSMKEEERNADHLRKEIDSIKERISRARMEESEVHFRLGNLADLVREKFNLDLPQIHEHYLDEGFSEVETEERLESLKALRQKIGEVNLTAIKEHEALKERFEFITKQREDLIQSIESLQKVIKKINKTSLENYRMTFEAVDRKLKVIFPILFNGGSAGLKMIDETQPLDSGVLVEVRPPGKRLSHMGLLSGGEKALVAMALLFAIYMIRPSPFCLLDEVDAPLDEANLDRFNDLLKEITKSSQVIMVTHNRRTMEVAHRLYGITMEKAGISKVVSVDLQRVKNGRPESAPASPQTSN